MSDESGDPNPYSIVAFIFDGQGTARQKLRQIRLSGGLDVFVIEARAVVEQDENGQVRVHEPSRGVLGAVGGATIGSLLGALGGPIGILTLGAIGATVGGAAGRRWGRDLPIQNLESLGQNLTPDSSAFLLLLEGIQEELLIDSLQSYDPDNVVTLTVDEILSGELASYRTAAQQTVED
jgi:uncharacterized membrane protein